MVNELSDTSFDPCHLVADGYVKMESKGGTKLYTKQILR